MSLNKTSSEVTGYDLSSTGVIIELITTTFIEIGWIVTATSPADFVVEVQPEGSSNWYEIDTYTDTTSIDDGVVAPEAFRARIRNTDTVTATADAVLGGADR
jgi:hypothetical protein